ncbi:hypothetical protein M569_05868, partial [Genlisea aurea]
MELLNAALLISSAAVFAVLWWVGKKPRKNLPPGPPGWPIVGNLFQIILQGRHFVFYARELREKYGPIFTLKMGQRTLVVVSSSELMHEALVQRGALFASRPPESPIRLIFSSGKCTINSAEYGPVWRSLRRNFVSELLTPARIRQCGWIRKWAVENHMERVEKEGAAVGFVGVMSNCRLTICSILICLCFGVKISEEDIKVLEAVLKDVVLMTMPKLPDFMPVLTPFFRRHVAAAKELRRRQLDCLVPLLRKRKDFVDGVGAREEMASPLGAAYIDSLFGLQVPGRGKLGEEEMVSLCSEAINGGTDTSAATLEWALFHLVQNQDIQEKLFGEIVSVAGKNNDGVITETEVERMPYLEAVVKETLRKHPPIYFLLSHAATQEMELGGYTIPADVNVEFYTGGISEDPEMWDNPTEFRPERFLTGDGVEVDITGMRGVRMLPFGAGRRICPAWTLGVLHVNLLLAKMVQAFKWLPSPEYPPSAAEIFAGTVVMKNSLRAIILPRS